MFTFNGSLNFNGNWIFGDEPASGNLIPQFTVSQFSGPDAPTDTAANNFFGRSLYINGDTMLIGASGQSTNRGAAYLYNYTSGTSTWTQQVKFVPTNTAGAPQFGYSSAVYNTIAAVGSPFDEPDGANARGSVYMYQSTSGTWSTTATQVISEATIVNSSQYGTAIDLNNTTLVVGAPLDTASSTTSAGQVYIYTFSGSAWTRQAIVNAGSNIAVNARFGQAVSLIGDTLIVGASGENTNLGAIYVFTRSGTTWSSGTRIAPITTATGIFFGNSLKLKGINLVVGAPGSVSDVSSSSAAASRVFLFTGSGSSWAQSQEFTVTTAAGGTLVDSHFGVGRLGSSVDINTAGNVIIAGAYRAQSTTGGTNGGATYVFEYASNVWSASAIGGTSSLRPATEQTTNNGELFGYQVALHSDTQVIVTAIDRNPSSTIPNGRGAFTFFK